MTGSAGNIGQHLITHLKDKHQFRGFDINPTDQLDDYVVANVNDWEAINHASKDMDATIHLSNCGGEWEQAQQSMVGTRHVFEAAMEHGGKRIIFASRGGVHPSSIIPRSVTRTADLRTHPDSYYTITKVFGEAMGDMFSSRHGFGVVSVRIGNFNKDRPEPGHPHQLGHGDCVLLFDAALTAKDIGHERVFGVSDSNWPLYDLEHGRKVIGYNPQQRSEVAQDVIDAG
jgi:uronate dehydrogenase